MSWGWVLSADPSRLRVLSVLLGEMGVVLPALPPLFSFSFFPPSSLLALQQACTVPPQEARTESDTDALGLRGSHSHGGARGVSKHCTVWPGLRWRETWRLLGPSQRIRDGFLEEEASQVSPETSV